MDDLETMIDQSTISRLSFSHTSRDEQKKITKIHLVWKNLTSQELNLAPKRAVLVNENGIQKDLTLTNIAFTGKSFLLEPRYINILPKLSIEYIVGLNDGIVKLTKNSIIAIQYLNNGQSDVTAFKISEIFDNQFTNVKSDENLIFFFSEGNVKIENEKLTIGDYSFNLENAKELAVLGNSKKRKIIGLLIFVVGVVSAVLIIGFFIMAYALHYLSKKKDILIQITTWNNQTIKLKCESESFAKKIVNKANEAILKLRKNNL